ncbi:Cyclopropane-fatty-acyl-phospholipid synthase [compost metagenome]
MSTDFASTPATLDSGRENSSTRFVRTLLQQADIAINGDQPWDMKVYHPDVPRRALAHGNLGLGEALYERRMEQR